MMINNLPNYINEYRYIVARRDENQLWFWGAWNNRTQANNAAIEVGGEVIMNNGYEGAW